MHMHLTPMHFENHQENGDSKLKITQAQIQDESMEEITNLLTTGTQEAYMEGTLGDLKQKGKPTKPLQ